MGVANPYFCARDEGTGSAQNIWDDRITRWRVPSAFDPQGPRHSDEAVVVALVVEI